MHLLHASWLPALPPALFIWAETQQFTPSRPRRSKPGSRAPAPHPFSAPPEAFGPQLPVVTPAPEVFTALARLPSAHGYAQPSRPYLVDLPAGKTAPLALAAWQTPGWLYTPCAALELLNGLPAEPRPGLEYGPDLLFWRAAARLAVEVLAGQRYQPTLLEADGQWLARWQTLWDQADNRTRLDQLAAACPPAARAVFRDEQESENAPRVLVTSFVEAAVDAFARRQANFGGQRKRGRSGPAERWLAALTADDPHVELPADFIAQYQAWSQPPAPPADLRLCLRLEPPTPPASAEAVILHPPVGARDWTLRYFLQPLDDPSLLLPAETVWAERGATLRHLNRSFHEPQERLLAGLGLAGRLFPPVDDSLRQARPLGAALDVGQAHTFIRESALLLQAAGIGVLLPGLNAKLNLRLRLKPARKTGKAPAGGVAQLKFENIVAFNWELALGDQTLTPEEFQRLAALKEPLVQVRGEWVELRPEQLQQALDFLNEHAAAGGLSTDEALRLALDPRDVSGLPVADVQAEGWIGDLLSRLAAPGQLTPLAAPPGFRGQLRPYQAAGLAWLDFLGRFGLGACLADDMGLGKTIQTLAYLLRLKDAGEKRPSLLVCPTSVVGNWQREAARFAPDLRVLAHHGAGREKDAFARQARRHDLVLTSYALLARDQAALAAVKWNQVILDEAQNIKNPDTRQARAARELTAARRLALTGTPVENRLAELWSLFQFLNPGFLGSRQNFQADFARPIERLQDPDAAGRLRQLTGPFILRRVKTDPSVISDLPAKNEMKVYCPLTREQATLYGAVVRDSLRQIEESEGIKRRALVLTTLMKLKQVCNHPAHFLGDGSPLAERSGKLERLLAMLEEVRATHERALIFTQFAEMGELLRGHLEASGAGALFLHGGTPIKTRQTLVDRFQNDPHAPAAFILSLKAGGTGLNLTGANHVFHFDRWWNPAVENQATDRAFRIGQTRNVQVYKFICAGTVEERVDEIIQRKVALADSVVGASESWITELSTTELRDLFRLRAEALD